MRWYKVYFFFRMDIKLIQHHLLKTLSVLSLNHVCNLSKNMLTIYVWVCFWSIYCSLDLHVYLFAKTKLS